HHDRHRQADRRAGSPTSRTPSAGDRDGGTADREPGARLVSAKGFEKVRCRPARGTIAPRRRGAPSLTRYDAVMLAPPVPSTAKRPVQKSRELSSISNLHR